MEHYIFPPFLHYLHSTTIKESFDHTWFPSIPSQHRHYSHGEVLMWHSGPRQTFLLSSLVGASSLMEKKKNMKKWGHSLAFSFLLFNYHYSIISYNWKMSNLILNPAAEISFCNPSSSNTIATAKKISINEWLFMWLVERPYGSQLII